jgi:hypothetical protein
MEDQKLIVQEAHNNIDAIEASFLDFRKKL